MHWKVMTYWKVTKESSVSDRETAREVADQAAEWATRIDSGSIAPDTDEGLRRWLDEDPRRRGALLRAEAALSFMDRGRALAGVVPKPEPRPIWIRRKLMYAGAALAAGVVGVAVLMIAPHRFGTGLGEVRQVPLSDGSLVAINTQSTVEVTMRPDRREVALTRGEAWFRVAHDTKRPFIVTAGRIRVRAIGTAFSVRRHDDGVDVQVTEGVVETWTVGEEDRRVRVAAGSRAHVVEYEPPKPIPAAADIERSLAWRAGQIVLEGETLDEAAAQFNRYNARKLVISDPALAEEKLVGQFRATEPMTFAGAVATTLGAMVVEEGDTIRLSRPPRH
jgi:transmembrane sensor